jgi:Fe-S-cluster-containing dehydrogenase component
MDNRICMVIDIDRCWGCKACEVACKQEMELDVGPRPMLVVDVGPRKIGDNLHKDSLPTMCQHCEQPACMEACLSGAIYRETDGTVQINAASCIGCAACQTACPFGAIDIMPQAGGRAVKCTLCFQRRQDGRIPSCAQHCIGRAFTLTNEEKLTKVIGNRYSWSNGRVTYVSQKWSSLGETLVAKG